MERTNLITENGFNKIKEQYNLYLKEKRQESIAAIKEARDNSSGEISDNIEYLEALSERDRIEKKISEFEAILNNIRVVKTNEIIMDGIVRFGVNVKLLRLTDEKELNFKIVGTEESNIKEGLLSYISPLAQELLGQEKEDIVECSDIEYEILDIYL